VKTLNPSIERLDERVAPDLLGGTVGVIIGIGGQVSVGGCEGAGGGTSANASHSHCTGSSGGTDSGTCHTSHHSC